MALSKISDKLMVKLSDQVDLWFVSLREKRDTTA